MCEEDHTWLIILLIPPRGRERCDVYYGTPSSSLCTAGVLSVLPAVGASLLVGSRLYTSTDLHASAGRPGGNIASQLNQQS